MIHVGDDKDKPGSKTLPGRGTGYWAIASPGETLRQETGDLLLLHPNGLCCFAAEGLP